MTQRSPAGRLRILCSGDSFTMGSGVDNDHTWCALLAAKDPRFEGLNLGQGGYGFDQAYLRFKRDGRPLEHAVHIYAFISDDFRRMGSSTSWYWGKPTLVLRNGSLMTENVPVPQNGAARPPDAVLSDSGGATPDVPIAQGHDWEVGRWQCESGRGRQRSCGGGVRDRRGLRRDEPGR